MKTNVIIIAILLLGMTGAAQNQQAATADKESYKFRLIDMTIIAGPGAIYPGSLKSITDSSLTLIPQRKESGYIELFFPYDRIDTIIVSSRHYSSWFIGILLCLSRAGNNWMISLPVSSQS
jgi:hypothetical protein